MRSWAGWSSPSRDDLEAGAVPDSAPSAHGLVQAGPERHLPPAAGPRGLESITPGRRRDEVASVLVPVAVLTVGRRWIQQEDGLLCAVRSILEPERSSVGDSGAGHGHRV